MPELKVLIVEDEYVIAAQLRGNLNQLGYGITEIVSTGEEAVASARREMPDLILMDITLNGALDGIKTAENITHFQSVPIVYITAYSDPEFRERAYRAGAAGYLVKPITVDELRESIEKALGGKIPPTPVVK